MPVVYIRDPPAPTCDNIMFVAARPMVFDKHNVPGGHMMLVQTIAPATNDDRSHKPKVFILILAFCRPAEPTALH